MQAKNRIEYLIICECDRANPNGGDNGEPRTIDGIWTVTRQCLNNMIREMIQTGRDAGWLGGGYRLYYGRNRTDKLPGAAFGEWKRLEKNRKKAAQAVKKAAETGKGLAEACAGMETAINECLDFLCRHFYDVRCFGAVFSPYIYGLDFRKSLMLKGPIRMGRMWSFREIWPEETSLTRKGVSKDSDFKKGKRNAIGRKYRADGILGGFATCNPADAVKTHFSGDDLEFFENALCHCWTFGRSGGRAGFYVCRVLKFEMPRPDGGCSRSDILDALEFIPGGNPDRFFDGKLNIDYGRLEELGVTVTDLFDVSGIERVRKGVRGCAA